MKLKKTTYLQGIRVFTYGKDLCDRCGDKVYYQTPSLLGGEAEAAAVNTITSITTVLSHLVSWLPLPLLQPLYV